METEDQEEHTKKFENFNEEECVTSVDNKSFASQIGEEKGIGHLSRA